MEISATENYTPKKVRFVDLGYGDTFVLPESYRQIRKAVYAQTGYVNVLCNKNKTPNDHVFMKIAATICDAHTCACIIDPDGVSTSSDSVIVNAVSLSTGDHAIFLPAEQVVQVDAKVLIKLCN